jgi:hypothetical protein
MCGGQLQRGRALSGNARPAILRDRQHDALLRVYRRTVHIITIVLLANNEPVLVQLKVI